MTFFLGSKSSMSVDDSLAFNPTPPPPATSKKNGPLRIITQFFIDNSESLAKSLSIKGPSKSHISKPPVEEASTSAIKLILKTKGPFDDEDLPVASPKCDLTLVQTTSHDDSGIGSSSNESTTSTEHSLGLVWSGNLSKSQENEEAYKELFSVKIGDTLNLIVRDRVLDYPSKKYNVVKVGKWEKNIHDVQQDGFKHEDFGMGQKLKLFQNGQFKNISIKAI
jgi:hypothetical protein